MKKAVPRVSTATWIGLAAVALIGLAFRWWIFGASQGAVSADEAYTGLQALRILDGDLPLVIEGQAYTAVFDSYLLAPILGLVGASVWVLKALPLVWWALASVLIARIAIKTVSRPTALVVGALFWVAPGALMLLSTRAYEGYGLGLIFVLAACSAAQRSVSGTHPETRTSIVVGAMVGLALYAHPMYLAVVAPILVLPSIKHRRDTRRWWLPMIASLVLANVPLIVWNVRNGWSTLDQPSSESSTYFGRLGSLLSDVTPRVFGLRDLDGLWTLGAPTALVVLVLIGVLVARGIVVLARRDSANRVVAVTATLSLPLLAVFRSTVFVEDARYGIVFFPFLLVALVVGATSFNSGEMKPFVIGVVMVVWSALLVVPWLSENQGPRRGDPNADARGVIGVLHDRGFDSVAGSFWWVLPIEYLSNREIRGAVAGDPFTVRVVDSQRLVEAKPNEAVPYVFSAGDEQTSVLPLPVGSYERMEIGDAVVYLPRAEGSG